MTFDSSVDLIWKLKKAQVLPSNEPVESQRPTKNQVESKRKIIRSRPIQQVENDLNQINIVDFGKDIAIVPEQSENFDNEEDIETSMFISEAAKEKEPPSKVDNIILGTPPQPQQGLNLLHKAPRIGLSKLQNVLTLHPRLT